MPLRIISASPEQTGYVVTLAADTFPEVNDVSLARRMAADVAKNWNPQPMIVREETQTLNKQGQVLPNQISSEDVAGGLQFRRVITFTSIQGQFVQGQFAR